MQSAPAPKDRNQVFWGITGSHASHFHLHQTTKHEPSDPHLSLEMEQSERKNRTLLIISNFITCYASHTVLGGKLQELRAVM